MDGKPRIAADPQIMNGAVCLRGTRIAVSVGLDNLAAGKSTVMILDECPTLKAVHIPAAMGYAADLARGRHVPVPAQERVRVLCISVSAASIRSS